MYSSLPLPEQNGWIHQPDGTYEIEWESQEIQASIQSSTDFLLKGCNCKKGCKTNICGCRKKKIHCGPGCLCQGCTNLLTTINDIGDDSTDSESDTSDSSSDEILAQEIIPDEFNFEIPDPP